MECNEEWLSINLPSTKKFVKASIRQPTKIYIYWKVKGVSQQEQSR